MLLPFEKWHGCKNDFVIFWMIRPDQISIDSIVRQTPKICSRSGDGIGADGVIVLTIERKEEIEPSHMMIINSDGSIAETCGNGLRCATGSVLKRWREIGNTMDPLELVEFNLGKRQVTGRFLTKTKVSANSQSMPMVAVEMGVAKIDDDVAEFEKGKAFVESKAKELGMRLNGELHFINVGNLHVVIPVQNLDRKMLHSLGQALQKSDSWDGINVHLIETVEISDRDQVNIANVLGSKAAVHYNALVWERGAGPTQACGSGVCAIAASAIAESDCQTGEWAAVAMPGGTLYAMISSMEDPVLLAGPQEFVFDGKILL